MAGQRTSLFQKFLFLFIFPEASSGLCLAKYNGIDYNDKNGKREVEESVRCESEESSGRAPSSPSAHFLWPIPKNSRAGGTGRSPDNRDLTCFLYFSVCREYPSNNSASAVFPSSSSRRITVELTCSPSTLHGPTFTTRSRPDAASVSQSIRSWPKRWL